MPTPPILPTPSGSEAAASRSPADVSEESAEGSEGRVFTSLFGPGPPRPSKGVRFSVPSGEEQDPLVSMRSTARTSVIPVPKPKDKAEDPEDEAALPRGRISYAGSLLNNKGSFLALFMRIYGAKEKKKRVQKDEEEARTLRRMCYRISEHNAFRLFFTVLLISSIVSLAFEADAEAYRAIFPEDITRDADLFAFMSVSEHIFLALFIVEITIRTIGCPTKPWRDGWLVFDGNIVGMSILDTWVLRLVEASSGGLTSFGILRALRMIRAFRAFRILRLIRYVRALKLVAEGLSDAFKNIVWGIVVAGVTTWCGAIVMVITLSSTPEAPGFTWLGDGLLTLVLVVTRSIPWGPEVVEPLLFRPGNPANNAVYILGGVIIVLMIMALLAGFLSIISGVLIGSLIDASAREMAMIQSKTLSQGILCANQAYQLYCSMDQQESGELTIEEFMDGAQENQHFCDQVGLKVSSSATIFKQMDVRGTGTLGLDEFLLGMLKMKCSSKSSNLMCMDHMQRTFFRKNFNMTFQVGSEFQSMTSSLAEVDSRLTNVNQRMLALTGDLHNNIAIPKRHRVVADLELLPKHPVFGDLDDLFDFRPRFKELKACVRAASNGDPIRSRAGQAGVAARRRTGASDETSLSSMASSWGHAVMRSFGLAADRQVATNSQEAAGNEEVPDERKHVVPAAQGPTSMQTPSAVPEGEAVQRDESRRRASDPASLGGRSSPALATSDKGLAAKRLRRSLSSEDTSAPGERTGIGGNSPAVPLATPACVRGGKATPSVFQPPAEISREVLLEEALPWLRERLQLVRAAYEAAEERTEGGNFLLPPVEEAFRKAESLPPPLAPAANVSTLGPLARIAAAVKQADATSWPPAAAQSSPCRGPLARLAEGYGWTTPESPASSSAPPAQSSAPAPQPAVASTDAKPSPKGHASPRSASKPSSPRLASKPSSPRPSKPSSPRRASKPSSPRPSSTESEQLSHATV